MAKSYFLTFGVNNPSNYSGLAPTLIIFSGPTGTTFAGPAITEIFSGAGIYTFTYGATTPIAFVADGFTTSLGVGRYVTGSIDPADRSDEYGNTLLAFSSTLTAYGSTLTAYSSTLTAYSSTLTGYGVTILSFLASGGTVSYLGTPASSFGTQSSDPTDAFGYLKRILENLEGDQTFTKNTGAMTISSRGSSTLLRNKTVSNTVTQVTKSGT